jgi:hypothetical protein
MRGTQLHTSRRRQQRQQQLSAVAAARSAVHTCMRWMHRPRQVNEEPHAVRGCWWLHVAGTGHWYLGIARAVADPACPALTSAAAARRRAALPAVSAAAPAGCAPPIPPHMNARTHARAPPPPRTGPLSAATTAGAVHGPWPTLSPRPAGRPAPEAPGQPAASLGAARAHRRVSRVVRRETASALLVQPRPTP